MQDVARALCASSLLELRKLLVDVALARDERAAVALDVRERAEAVVLQFEDPVRMIEGARRHESAASAGRTQAARSEPTVPQESPGARRHWSAPKSRMAQINGFAKNDAARAYRDARRCVVPRPDPCGKRADAGARQCASHDQPRGPKRVCVDAGAEHTYRAV